MLSMPRDGNGQPACVMNIDGVPYRLGDGESLLYEINTRVWLGELARKYQRPVNLATIPEQE